MHPPLIDPFARPITYLRVSVTDRCDFRCVYCMAEHMQFLPKADLLTLEELDRLSTAFIGLGVRKLRITGGEPLVRRGIMGFFRNVSRHLGNDLDELTLTTNGSQLARHAAELADIGVRRVNVSLDTLDADKFAAITRWGRLPQVLEGIRAATAAGLRVKINAVALKGVNDSELFDLVQWCGDEGHDLTFIEVMPMGEMGEEDRLDQYWPLSDLRARLGACALQRGKQVDGLGDRRCRAGRPAVRSGGLGGRRGLCRSRDRGAVVEHQGDLSQADAGPRQLSLGLRLG